MFKLHHFCLAAVATALPAAAMADIGFYMGAGMGGSRVERDDIFLSFDEYTTGTLTFLTDPPYNVAEYREQAVVVEDPEGTDFAFKVFGGVRFGTYVGVEAGYIDLGTATDGFPFVIPPITSGGGVTQLRPLQDRQIDVET